MQAILNININEVNNNLLNIIKELLLKNIEVIIRKDTIKIEEFNKNIPLSKVMVDFSENGYSKEFLQDLKEGFDTSTLYSKEYENNIN
jgi:hypothetical protein